jgi:hypothetical protein
VIYLDKTFDSPDSTGDDAILDRLFRVTNAPTYLAFSAHQRSGNDWVYDGGGDPLSKQGSAEIKLIRLAESEGAGGLVASVFIDMDTGGDNILFEQTFPLEAVELGDPAGIQDVYGTVTATYYIPAGHGVDAFVRHSSDETLNFDYQAVLQRLW